MVHASKSRGKEKPPKAITRRRRDHDNDDMYRNPRAWGDTKRAFRHHSDIVALMKIMGERAGDGCPRLSLAIAMHAYLVADQPTCVKMIREYSDWTDAHKDDEYPPLVRKQVTPHGENLARIAPRVSVRCLQILQWIADIEDTKNHFAEFGDEDEAIGKAIAEMETAKDALFDLFRERFPRAINTDESEVAA